MPDFTRLDTLRAQHPLVHCIDNQVTANDCANLALAVGASPMMASAPEEIADITAASRATVINTGTPDNEKFRACLGWGQAAMNAGQPIVLDPVGIGASRWRLQSVMALLHMFTPTILRCNMGEALALLQKLGVEQGVDSTADFTLEERTAAAAALARHRRTTVLLSGPEDVISDGKTSWRVSGGSSQSARITGTGCMLSVLCGAFAAVEPNPVDAALLASSFWKLCSQRAEAAAQSRGAGTYHAALFDAASTLTSAELAAEAQVQQL